MQKRKPTDSPVPPPLTIAIAAAWTATPPVSLCITSRDTASVVADMRFSDDGSSWSSWATAAATGSWTLPTGDGTKTVHLQLRDAAGNLYVDHSWLRSAGGKKEKQKEARKQEEQRVKKETKIR